MNDQEWIYCYFCGNDMSEKSVVNDFPPCEVCNKIFSLKILNSCSPACSLGAFKTLQEDNVFTCSCGTKICNCECRWLHFYDKDSCKCNSCVNNYDEMSCEQCNKKLERIVVINLPFNFSQEAFSQFFSKYGELSNAYIALDVQGKSRGFGFVKFKKFDHMQACLADNIIIEDRPIRCTIETANIKTY